MTERIEKKLAFLKNGEYKKQRRRLEGSPIALPETMSEAEVHTYLHKYMMNAERPRLYEDDRFGFNRTVQSTPIAFVGETKREKSTGNITINYPYVLSVGMDAILERVNKKLAECSDGDGEKRELYTAMKESIEVCLGFADSYRAYAKEQGATELYEALCTVPHKGAQSFHQACVFVKFIQFTLRCNRNEHITLGGFDKYMLPYFEEDLKRGVSEDELFELLEDFFITLNIDTDTYFGVQQGDNGLSMVLGGRDINGKDTYNRLSELCIKASMELCLIDPKINLRVDKNTPIERLEFATELTKKGLGFPQYSNDDVVIPGLIKLGYTPEDAHNYTVAACWEFIIPNKSHDIPNIERVNFPLAVERAVNERLSACNSFEEFMKELCECVEDECHTVARKMLTKDRGTSPYLSVFVDDCIERGLDLARGGAVYINYGAHGVGIAPAADAIAAVKKAVFEEKRCSAEELVRAIKANFEGYNELRNYLLSCPKMGNNDDYVDSYGSLLMDIFARVFKEYKNVYGGCFRAGTGSAMEYLRSAEIVGATADGRYAKTPFGSSFSPSPTTRLNGPLSCIQSFTKHDLSEIINGGPLTMEIHDNTFRNGEGVKKVAALVKAFIDLGGHQLQLNSINREVLLDAQKHPEAHKNLIVRVWGWSGYFNELDTEYQNHIISRTEFMA